MPYKKYQTRSKDKEKQADKPLTSNIGKKNKANKKPFPEGFYKYVGYVDDMDDLSKKHYEKLVYVENRNGRMYVVDPRILSNNEKRNAIKFEELVKSIKQDSWSSTFTNRIINSDNATFSDSDNEVDMEMSSNVITETDIIDSAESQEYAEAIVMEEYDEDELLDGLKEPIGLDKIENAVVLNETLNVDAPSSTATTTTTTTTSETREADIEAVENYVQPIDNGINYNGISSTSSTSTTSTEIVSSSEVSMSIDFINDPENNPQRTDAAKQNILTEAQDFLDWVQEMDKDGSLPNQEVSQPSVNTFLPSQESQREILSLNQELERISNAIKQQQQNLPPSLIEQVRVPTAIIVPAYNHQQQNVPPLAVIPLMQQQFSLPSSSNTESLMLGNRGVNNIYPPNFAQTLMDEALKLQAQNAARELPAAFGTNTLFNNNNTHLNQLAIVKYCSDQNGIKQFASELKAAIRKPDPDGTKEALELIGIYKNNIEAFKKLKFKINYLFEDKVDGDKYTFMKSKSNHRKTLLSLAACHQKLAVAEALVKVGGLFSKRHDHQEGGLDYAIYNGQIKMVELALKQKIDLFRGLDIRYKRNRASTMQQAVYMALKSRDTTSNAFIILKMLAEASPKDKLEHYCGNIFLQDMAKEYVVEMTEVNKIFQEALARKPNNLYSTTKSEKKSGTSTSTTVTQNTMFVHLAPQNFLNNTTSATEESEVLSNINIISGPK